MANNCFLHKTDGCYYLTSYLTIFKWEPKYQVILQRGAGALEVIDKFLIINQILILLHCSLKYNLWNLMYKIFMCIIIEFLVLVGPIAQGCTVDFAIQIVYFCKLKPMVESKRGCYSGNGECNESLSPINISPGIVKSLQRLIVCVLP